jgi:hypothetical protein
MVYFHTPALTTRRRTAGLLQRPADNLLAMLQTNFASITLCHHGPSLWHCHRAENQAVAPVVSIIVSASLHSALKRPGLLTASAALAALAPLLGLDSCLPPTILIILDVVTTCTRASLIVGPNCRYLGRLRILAASTAGRLRSGHRHLVCIIAICSLLGLPPGLLIFLIILR